MRITLKDLCFWVYAAGLFNQQKRKVLKLALVLVCFLKRNFHWGAFHVQLAESQIGNGSNFGMTKINSKIKKTTIIGCIFGYLLLAQKKNVQYSNIADASALKLYKCFWNSNRFIRATEEKVCQQVKVRAKGNASWDKKMPEFSILHIWTIWGTKVCCGGETTEVSKKDVQRDNNRHFIHTQVRRSTLSLAVLSVRNMYRSVYYNERKTKTLSNDINH